MKLFLLLYISNGIYLSNITDKAPPTTGIRATAVTNAFLNNSFYLLTHHFPFKILKFLSFCIKSKKSSINVKNFS